MGDVRSDMFSFALSFQELDSEDPGSDANREDLWRQWEAEEEARLRIRNQRLSDESSPLVLSKKKTTAITESWESLDEEEEARRQGAAVVNGSNELSPPGTMGTTFRTQGEQPPFLSPWQTRQVYINIFLCAVGLMLPWSAVLASVSVYEQKYGKNVMVFISAAYYLPALPIFLLQAALDRRVDMKYKSHNTFRIRNSVALLGNIGVLVALYLSHSVIALSITALFIGFFGSIGYGSFWQLLSLLPHKNNSFFSMGLFSPTFALLGIQAFTGYGFPGGIVDDKYKAEVFWGLSILLELLCIGAYVLLEATAYVRFFYRRKDRHDLREEKIRQRLAEAEQGMGRVTNTDLVSASRSAIVKAIWPSLVAIFMSILGSVTTTTLFAYVPSSYGFAYLAVVLTYVKNFSDFSGRVITLIPAIMIQNGKVVLSWGLFRGLMLPVFLVYTFTNLWHNDVFIVFFVLGISVLSGYLNTAAYRYAAAAAPAGGKAQAAAIMNIFFQASIYCSFIFQFTFLPLMAMQSS